MKNGEPQVIIKDDKGQQIFAKDIKQTSFLTVEVPEKIEITISASGHKGKIEMHY